MKKIFGGLTILLIAGLVLAGCSNPAGGDTSVGRSVITINPGDTDLAVSIMGTATPSDRTNASGPKITSNGNNSAFPGINFIFDNGKYSGYLKVQKDVFKYYDNFTLTVKTSSVYTDYTVQVQPDQKLTPQDNCYMFFVPATEDGKKVNMVFIPNYSLVAPKTFEVQFYDRNQNYMFSQEVWNGGTINWFDPQFGQYWDGDTNGFTVSYKDIADLYNGGPGWNAAWAVPDGYVCTGNWCKLGDNTNVYIKTGEYSTDSVNYPPTQIHESVKLWPQVREVAGGVVPPTPDPENPVAQVKDIGFIGYYKIYLADGSYHVSQTSFYWQHLEEGQSIDWAAVNAAYADWAAQGGYPLDGVTSWQCSGWDSWTKEGLNPPISYSDFSKDQLESYYGKYYLAPQPNLGGQDISASSSDDQSGSGSKQCGCGGGQGGTGDHGRPTPPPIPPVPPTVASVVGTYASGLQDGNNTQFTMTVTITLSDKSYVTFTQLVTGLGTGVTGSTPQNGSGSKLVGPYTFIGLDGTNYGTASFRVYWNSGQTVTKIDTVN